MKVVYNWLKDFVDVTATPQELASRLALSGTNIGGVKNGPHGAVIEAEVSSNRPDCLGHLGIAREVAAIYKQPLVFTPPRPEESASVKANGFDVRPSRGLSIGDHRKRLEACGGHFLFFAGCVQTIS